MNVTAVQSATLRAISWNSSCPNNRRHWRTPSRISQVFSIQAESVLPSRRLTRIPASLGLARNTRLISVTCFSLNRLGRPERSPSVSPVNPCCW